MTEFKLNFFANDRFKLLTTLLDNQIKADNEWIIPMNQQGIADTVGFSKLKTNKLLNDLINNGYVIKYNGKNGKYQLTEQAIKAIHLMKKNNV